ncbi:MAG TPA: thiamine phosphate synthase [Gammaproteobacteria bacterium]|nr:thiamine phosphate synthase [Gammaproteobacteria bacterium]
MKLPAGGLYAITDSEMQGDALERAVAAAIAGGAALIQYRDKTTDRRRRLRDGERLRNLCRDADIGLIINDDVELAAALNADGVHLGADDMPLAEARARLGKDAIIGVSCYDSLACAEQAAASGADYVAFGSFYPSSTKPGAVRAPIDLLRAARGLRVPVIAIGGITPVNGQALINAGAHFLAVISGVFGTGDIQRAAQSYADLFATTPGSQWRPADVQHESPAADRRRSP